MPEKIIIIGAGASGLFCAFLLAQAGKDVTVLESGQEAARKLAISGGGHANFTNLNMSADKFLCQPQDGFCAQALCAFPPEKILVLLEKWNFAWLEKAGGRLFLQNSAKTFASRLLKECELAGAKVIYGRTATAITPELAVETSQGCFFGDAIILAQGSICGGVIAGSGANIALASGLGHKRLPFSPALAPLEFSGQFPERAAFCSLAGISLPVTARLDKTARSWKGNLLFTHKGLSGPAILNASLYWSRKTNLVVDFLQGHDFEAMLDAAPGKTPVSLLRRFIPSRVAEALLESENMKNGNLSRTRRKALAGRVNEFQFTELKKGPMRLAEVCSGGISTEKINPETLESELAPGVYFIGEALAVTGALGGYNLHWAWASANAAARAICAAP